MTTKLSRRGIVQGAGAAALAAGAPNAPAFTLPPVAGIKAAYPARSVQFESAIGTEIMDLIRSYHRDDHWMMVSPTHVPALFDPAGLLNMSVPFRDGLERFLGGDEDVIIPRPEDAGCATFEGAYARYRATRDRFILFLFRKFVIAQQRGVGNLDPIIPRGCYGFYGEFDGEPRATALMLSRREEFFKYGPRPDRVIAPFSRCRVV